MKIDCKTKIHFRLTDCHLLWILALREVIGCSRWSDRLNRSLSSRATFPSFGARSPFLSILLLFELLADYREITFLHQPKPIWWQLVSSLQTSEFCICCNLSSFCSNKCSYVKFAKNVITSTTSLKTLSCMVGLSVKHQAGSKVWSQRKLHTILQSLTWFLLHIFARFRLRSCQQVIRC